MTTGFIKLNRSAETLELLRDPNAFILLTVIALRARRSDAFNTHSLASGEALIGDHERYGLTRCEYRTAVRHLGIWGLARFESTSRGTVATLIDSRVYDINEIARDHRAAIEGPTRDHQATTNKNEKKKKNEKKEKSELLCGILLELILERKPDFCRPPMEPWNETMAAMLDIDGRTPERVEAVIRWSQRDPFWSMNILNPALLRRHFDRLELEMARGCETVPQENLRDQIARMEREGTL